MAVRNDRFGEFLLNIPALRALKETFINAKLIVVVDPYVRELAEDIVFIDEIIEWSRAAHPLADKFRLFRSLKDKKIDIAVMLNPSKEFNIITSLARIPVRVGYNRKFGFLLTHKIEDQKYKGLKHEVEYNLELVGLIGAKTKDNTLLLRINDDLLSIDLPHNAVAIHPWTSDSVKQWPLTNFSELALRLVKELNAKVVIIGGGQGLNKSSEAFKYAGVNLMDMTGKTSLRQLAALLKKCRLLISGDSGPVHLACAAGRPVIAIFRNDIPGKTAKRWGPWGGGSRVIEKGSLLDITVDEVFNKTKEMLG